MKVARLITLFVVVAFLAVAGSFAQGTTGSQQTPSAPPQQSVQAVPPNPQNEAIEQDFEVPEGYVDRIKKEGAVLEVGLKDAIRLALTNNLNLEIENYNENLNRMKVFGARGYYDPVLSFSLGWNSSTTPATSILTAGQGVPTSIRKNWTFNTGLTQNVVAGGLFELTFDNSRTTTNSTFTTVNPTFNSGLQLSFTQPLLRGFKETQTERDLKLYNLDTKISDTQFQQQVSQTIRQVEDQYWELVYAIQNYEAQRRGLEMAIIQYRNNQKRVDIGVMAPIEITSSRAEVANRQQDMITSEVSIITAQNALKNLLAPDPKATIWGETLIPIDEPQIKEVSVTLDDAIQTALKNRPELERWNLQMEQTEVSRSYLHNQGKPQVNLVLGLTSNGTSGVVYGTSYIDTNGDGVPETPVEHTPQPSSPLWGNFGNSFGQAFGMDYLTYSAAIDVQIPLRNRTNDAQLAQNFITKRQQESQFRMEQQSVMVDVRNAYQGIATRRKALDAAQAARRLSQEKLDGENKRFEAGLSTNFEVLSYQRDLVNAQVNELRAMVNYQQALTALQTAMFTIINENDIVTARRNGNQ